MLRISTTTIDRFLLYLNTDKVSQESLIAGIKGELPPSEYTALGTAFHELIQNIEIPSKDGILTASNGIQYELKLIAQCYPFVNYGFPFEVKTTKYYNIKGEDMLVVAKADQLIGRHINEFKTCWTGFDYNTYLKSCQWRFCIDIFEADQINYIVFDLANKKDGITLKDIHQFHYNPYPNLDIDLKLYLNEFIEFVKYHQLEPYLINNKIETELIL